ncbi:MAG: heavy metal-associated domain-containing protein [Cyanobacteria bacterium P01_D01_bin.44]
METLKLKVGGMACGGCADNVQTKLAALPGVTQCSVSYDTKQATLQYNPSQVSLAQMQAAVKSDDFSLEPLP